MIRVSSARDGREGDDGRNAQPAAVALTEDELGTLDALQPGYTGTTPLQKNPYPNRSLAWAAWFIARLGGWDGYPSSRPPGPITTGRRWLLDSRFRGNDEST
jgi:hypothetical protein